MNITRGEKKQGTGNQIKYIGYFKGDLKYVNPTAEQIKEIYQLDEVPEEQKYTGKDKNEKDWAMVSFLFEDELTKIPVPYRIFISKDIAEFEIQQQDGSKVLKAWYINQHGISQLVADKKDLFRSLTHLQTWNKDEGKMVDILDESGSPIELSWRKAYKGETALYSLIRKLVTQDWWNATAENDLFIKVDSLMRGNVKDITTHIGTDIFQPVVGMIEIQSKDGENGINHYQNCVDQAWMQGFRIKEANINTSSNSWSRYEDKANGKGKNKELYEFYQAVKRNKHITEFKPIHEFNPDAHIASGNSTLQHSNESADISDTDY